jgi:acetyltransferase-like isoleucine patch superfamily enzyme
VDLPISWLGLQRARQSWRRDAGLPRRVRIEKAREYLWSLIMAPWYLRSVDEVGASVRVIRRPRIQNHGFIQIGEGSIIRSVVVPVELCTAPGARLTIGRGCSINYGVSIGATGRIVLGDRVRMGPYAMVIDSEFHDIYDRDRLPPPRPVYINDDVWIGTRASILPGVCVGQGAVVAAHALVNLDVPPFTVVGGVPAKPIAQLDPERLRRSHR